MEENGKNFEQVYNSQYIIYYELYRCSKFSYEIFTNWLLDYI